MKKNIARILALELCLSLTTGCGSSQTTSSADSSTGSDTAAGSGVTEISSLKIAFSPYADADQIVTATEPLEQLLQAKLLEKGYDVK